MGWQHESSTKIQDVEEKGWDEDRMGREGIKVVNTQIEEIEEGFTVTALS